MRPVPMNVHTAPPRNVMAATDVVEVYRTSLQDLCQMAGVLCRVTSELLKPVVLHAGTEHLRAFDASYVGVGSGSWKPTRVGALRVLEILAHGFHDYAARECICGRGLFCSPRQRGRPRIGVEPMTAAQRMRKMREARRAPSVARAG